jgi:hypothetical protein
MIGVSVSAGAVRLQGLHKVVQSGDLGGLGHAALIVQTRLIWATVECVLP